MTTEWELPRLRPADEDALDAALRLLAGRADTWGGGLSDHGPMGADALLQLGCAWEVVAWTCRYAERLAPVGPETAALRARLRGRLDRDGWKAVLADTLPLLLPGVLAGAFHGVIRVAHAARMVEARDVPLRRDELAAALASFVEGRTPLGDPPRVDGARDPRVILDTLPAAPPGEEWSITPRAVAAAAVPGFAAAIEGADLPTEPVSALHVLAEVGRDLLLAQPHAPVVYVHAITGPQAVAALVPLLDRTAAQEAVAYTWQALCAVHAAHRRPPADPDDEGLPDWPAVIAAAVASGDEHAIKGALACAVGDLRRPDPRWRRAASRLGRAG